jgi:hypothetical protein
MPDLSGMANPSAVSALQSVTRIPRAVRIVGGVHVEGETRSLITSDAKGPGSGFTITLDKYGVNIFKPNVADTMIPWARVASVEYAAGE